MRVSVFRKTKRSLAAAGVMLVVAGGYVSANGQTQNVTRPRTTTAVSASPERKIFVRSTALLVRAADVENKLMKRSEFKQLGLTLTRNPADADIFLLLRHDVLTKYLYSAVELRTQNVIAGGKVSSLGGTVAGKVAKRFLKQLAQGHP